MRADALRNREQLIATAADLFAKRGVDVPLEEIARQAGVSIGTLYNHFPNRGALLDTVLPERLAALDRLAEAAVADPDAWHGFAAFMDGLCTLLMHDRSMAAALARNTAQSTNTATECGRGAEVLESVVMHAKRTGALRADFSLDDLLTLVSAMSSVIVIFEADDTAWRRHLGFVLDGLRAANTPPSKGRTQKPRDDRH
jgi:AcrR family transcriptional regulator